MHHILTQPDAPALDAWMHWFHTVRANSRNPRWFQQNRYGTVLLQWITVVCLPREAQKSTALQKSSIHFTSLAITTGKVVAAPTSSWRAAPTQILSRGTPKLGDELAEVSQQVLLGTVAPKAAADRLEQGLKGWYAPHQGNQGKGQECQCEASVPAVPASGAIGTEPAAPVVPNGQAPSGASATDRKSVV